VTQDSRGTTQPVLDLRLEVKRALANLYDLVYLQRSPLASLLRRQDDEPVPPGQEAKALRKALVEAIEQLSPPDNVPLRSEKRRKHIALHARYVDQIQVEQLAHTLGLSERQVRRELKAGLEAVTRIIAGRLHWQEDQAAAHGGNNLLHELATLGPLIGWVDLCVEVRSVESLVGSLADNKGIILNDEKLPETVVLRANRVVLRQVLLALYSWIIENHQGITLSAEAQEADGDAAALVLRYSARGKEDDLRPDVTGPVVAPQLLEALGGSFEFTVEEQASSLRLILPSMRLHSILLIDDNRSIHQLFKRYLSGLPYRLHSAFDVTGGLAMARSVLPEAILADIMMPDQDGWELIAALKGDQTTSGIPVVLCSVLEQPAVAKTLSISCYLKKPVTQDALLTALQTLGLPGSA